MSLLRPDRYYNAVTDIRPEELQALGIRGLILDVDNTLTTHGSPEISPEVQAWLYQLKAQRFQLAVVSNNARSRWSLLPADRRSVFLARAQAVCLRIQARAEAVRPAAGADCRCGRPGIHGYCRCQGCGMHAFIVRPLEPETGPFFRFKRRLERPILRDFQ